MEEQKVHPTVSVVSEAVAEAGDIKPPSKKQLEKQKKKEEAYWGGMISRKDAAQMVQRAVTQAVQQEEERSQILFVTLHGLIDTLLDKGVITEEDLNNYSAKVAKKIYGIPDEEEATEQKEKEEATQPTQEG